MTKTMKVLWALAMAGGCGVEAEEGEATQAATTVTVSHSTMNTNGADVYLNDPFGSANLQVFAAGDGPSRVTTLWYSEAIYSPDYLFVDYSYLFGTIPNSDAELGERDAAIHTSGSGLYGEKCRMDFTTALFSCEPFVGSPIDVTLHADNMVSSTITGTFIYTSGKYSFRSQGTNHQISAHAVGTILGHEIDTSGALTDSRGTSVNKDVILTP